VQFDLKGCHLRCSTYNLLSCDCLGESVRLLT
jgi:hypothetical protein